MKTALLLSGGMDSLSLAWWLRPDIAITIDYGQMPAQAEIEAATAVCRRLLIEHHVVRIDCRPVGSGDMAGQVADPLAPASDWWPYRNQLLATLAAMKGIALGVTELWLGTVKSDGTHQDGTPGFLERLSELVAFQEGAMTVRAPAIALSTAELIKCAGIGPEVLAWAHSCHKSNVPCGSCRGCNKYFEVFDEIGHDLDRAR